MRDSQVPAFSEDWYRGFHIEVGDILEEIEKEMNESLLTLIRQEGYAVKTQCFNCEGRGCEYCDDTGYIDEENEALLQGRIDWEIDSLIREEERKWEEAEKESERALAAYV